MAIASTKWKVKSLLPFKIIGGCFAFLASCYLMLAVNHYHLIYNYSPSIPCGFYLVAGKAIDNLKIGDYVELNVPDEFKPYLYGRGWLHTDMTMVKQIGALPGDTMCVTDSRFTINGQTIGEVFTHDSQGLPLPSVRGCQTVEQGAFVPIGTHHPHSIDGRYMGAVSQRLIIGKAKPLWTF